ncbi:hypothetical protein DL93DRAFT_2178260 [Clavulina sp. PMI_390]|nr:hypothetical protein DL93DRAFT_2178260 [Clavulina sp. PMI_390]
MSSQAAGPSWRLLPFFSHVQVKDAHDAASSPEAFRSPAEISSTCSTSHGVAVADIHGGVHILGSTLEATYSWQAHHDGRVTHLIERKGILVTLGEERTSRLPLLKIWDLEHRDQSNAPTLLRSVKVQHGSRPDPVTTVALSSTLSHLAIGLGDGTVLLYRNLDQSLFSGSTSLTALPKPKTVHESSTEPITGLGFREPLHPTGSRVSEKEKEAEQLILFIVTTARVLSYIAAGKSSGSAPTVVDEVGCGLGCTTIYERTQEMVLARDDAIYMCSPEGRGACYIIEWPKISVTSFKNYLVLVSPPFFPSGNSGSATVRNYVARTPNAGAIDVSKLTILDMENHLTAYSEAMFTEGVRDVFLHEGSIHVLGNDGKLFRLEEKSTAQKLDLLFSRSLYPVAIGLAESEGLDPQEVATIHKQYADHLYAKGEFESATKSYVKTLGWVQPSYVIRKFLDAQQIHNLATYLQELHTKGLANADHTTLLLNTYTKLRDVSRLDAFIKSSTTGGHHRHGHHKSRKSQDAADIDALPFDLDTAIRVCRQAGYFDHAMYLAKKYKRHDDYLRIQIEDVGDGSVKDALTYLRSLGPEISLALTILTGVPILKAATNLVRYGRTLLSKLPDETTSLLIDVCSGVRDLVASSYGINGQPPSAVVNGKNGVTNGSGHSRSPTAGTGSGIPYLSLLNYNRAGGADSPTASPNPNATSSPDEMNEAPAPWTVPKDERVVVSEKQSTPSLHGRSDSFDAATVRTATIIAPRHPIPRPSQYFAHFVDHRTHFIRFLEAVAQNRWGQRIQPLSTSRSGDKKVAKDKDVDPEESEDQVAIWNTLLDLYLSAASDSAEALSNINPTEVELKQRAMNVLENQSGLPYDTMHALIVCSTHSFTDGLVLLWEKLGMYEEVLRFWMDQELHPERSITLSPSANSPTASARVIECLDKYGQQNPHLYTLVLRFLTSSPALLSRHTEDLKRLLNVVHEEKYIPPLGVVQILSRNEVASIGLVKEWLMERIQESREGVEADRELISSYRSETQTKLKEIAELSDPNKPKVFHATRCSVCGGSLDLPAVHFMCNHSYHSRCLNEHETECPTCARDHNLIREIRRDNEQVAAQHDLFLFNVENEGFSAVASAYSKGILGRGFDPLAQQLS